MTIGAGTRLFVLLGDPVAHSLSPHMQNAAFSASGLDAVYLALRCAPRLVAPLMEAVAAAGGGGNVTVPHKQLAADALQRPSEVVRATSACNTFWWENGALAGDNTDVTGFRAAAGKLLGNLQGVQALVLGAGGSARAAVYALLEAGAERVAIAGRTPANVEALIAQLDAQRRRAVALDPRQLAGRSFDLVVNATPAGMRANDPPPVALERLGQVKAVLDMVYAPVPTALVRTAERLGISALDGSEMLIAQGAAAFRLWFGREAPVEIMRSAVLSPAPAR